MKVPYQPSLKERTEVIGQMMLDAYCTPDILPVAKLTGFNELHEPTETLEDADIYCLLSNPDSEFLVKTAEYSMLFTSGWAAPNDDKEIKPSEHPDRRRVILVIGFNQTEQWASVGFSGDKEIHGCHEGSGPLAEAVKHLVLRSNKEMN